MLASKAHTRLADLAAAQRIVLTGLSRKFPQPTVKHIYDHQINLRMPDRSGWVVANRAIRRCHRSLTGYGGLTMVRRALAPWWSARVSLGCTFE